MDLHGVAEADTGDGLEGESGCLLNARVLGGLCVVVLHHAIQEEEPLADPVMTPGELFVAFVAEAEAATFLLFR